MKYLAANPFSYDWNRLMHATGHDWLVAAGTVALIIIVLLVAGWDYGRRHGGERRVRYHSRRFW